MNPVELHVVSDATGETATRVVAAVEAQFPDQGFVTVRHPRVETVDDLQLALARMEGRRAVVIFTLYISSDTVRSLYSHPQMLWAGCPVLMYWFARVMLLAQRGLIDDDPVIFALKDRVSWLSLGMLGIILFAAM